MREVYAGKEVSVSALGPLLDKAQGTLDVAYVNRLVPPDADRVSWDAMCELIDAAIPSAAAARKLGAEAVSSSAYKFHKRLRSANRLLGLEQLLRFMIYPRNPIDFSCLSYAVSGGPGQVDLVLYVNSRYRPSPLFFSILHGAAQELVSYMDLPRGRVAFSILDSQAHFSFSFREGHGWLDKAHAAGSRLVGGFLLRRLALRSYPDLVAGRKMFEEQLIERAKLEEQLRLAQDEFNARIDQVDDLIVEVDASGKLTYVSPNVKRLVGLDVTAKPIDFRCVVHHADVERVTRSVISAMQNPKGCRVDDFRIVDATGQIRWVEVDFRPTEQPPHRLIVVCRDVSERRQRHLEQMALDRRLEQVQRSEALGVLSGGIAHQFNNLLVPIMGEAELAALESAADVDIRSRLGHISSAAGKAAELVRQLSVYSGSARSVFSIIDLAGEARELLNLIRADISPAINVTTQLEAGALVEGDALQLRQLMMNLVNNAAESIGENSGEIVVTVAAHGERVELVISDDGPGMDELTKARAFEPFYTTKFTGRGLGLAAVMGIAQAHDGEISVQSNPGQGTKFILSLASAAESTPVAKQAVDFTGKFSGQALVVDDDAAVVTVAKALMEKLGFDVDTAVDGAQALDRISDNSYSVVLVDLVMPKVDGREVLSAIRRTMPTLPVVIVSGYGSGTTESEFTSDPATRFLSKPYRLNQLGKTLWSLNDLIYPIDASKTLSQ